MTSGSVHPAANFPETIDNGHQALERQKMETAPAFRFLAPLRAKVTERLALETRAEVKMVLRRPDLATQVQTAMESSWEDSEETVKGQVDQLRFHLEELQVTLKSERDPDKREVLLIEYEECESQLEQTCSNLTGISQQMGVVIGFLGDLRRAMVVMDQKMDALKKTMDAVAEDLSFLVGKPFDMVIAYKKSRMLEAESVRRHRDIYIPQKCVQESNFAKDGTFKIKDPTTLNPDLQGTMREFIESDQKSVMLVSGFAGSGKSTFAKIFLGQMWKQYDSKAYNARKAKIKKRNTATKDEADEQTDDTQMMSSEETCSNILPVHITLPAIKQPLTNLVQEGLAKMGISTSKQQSKLKDAVDNGTIRMLFILDGCK